MNNIFGYKSAEKLVKKKLEQEVLQSKEIMGLLTDVMNILNIAMQTYKEGAAKYDWVFPSITSPHIESINILAGLKERILFETNNKELLITELEKETS